MQPSWRPAVDGNLPPFTSVGGSWDALDKPGFHGWFSLIACIKWWGMGVASGESSEQRRLKGKWLDAVNDVQKMFGALQEHKSKATDN